jgi:hypothetical protein
MLCDYFTASSDQHAAETIDWVGGPSRPPTGGVGYPVIGLQGLEPVVMLGALEELLTARAFTDILRDPGHEPVAIRDGGERLVIPIGPRLEAALVALDNDGIRETAEVWCQAEEFGGQLTASKAADAISQLAALARDGSQTGHRVYCWLAV